MELEGSLSIFPLPEVLQFLAQGRMSGTLALSRGDTTIHLEIRDGKITNSSTMDRAHKLGEMLVHRNVIPRSVLDEALATQRQTDHGRLLGELLIDQGKVSREQLRSAIRLQMEEEIWELFGWREGQFKFEHGRTGMDRTAAVEIEIEPLLLEGSRRMDEWQHITKNINEDDDVFTVVPPLRDAPDSFPLKEREWIVLSLINGSFNIGSIIARTGYGTFETYRILNRLLMAGLIRKLPRPAYAKASSNGSGSSSHRLSAINEPIRTEPNGGGLKSLLGRRKGAGEAIAVELPARERLAAQTATPVGLAVSFINELLATLISSTEFSMGESDETLLESLWQPVVNICPKADMLKVRDNRLDAAAFEKFARLGASERMQGCYEDTVEALSRLLSRLYKVSSQRMGERNASRVFHSVCDAVHASGPLAFEPEFTLGPFVSKAIGLP